MNIARLLLLMPLVLATLAPSVSHAQEADPAASLAERLGYLTLMDLLTPQDIVIDHFAMAAPQVPADQWDTFYTGLLENFQPGVTEIIIHAALDNAEMRAVTIDHPDYGAAWRQRDLDFFTRDAFKHLLKQHDIPLITWREIGPFFRK